MSFFPPDPVMPEYEEGHSARMPWWGPPDDEVPVMFAAPHVLAATEHVSMALVGVHVYREGLDFRVERRLRRAGLPAAEWQNLSSRFMENWHGESGEDAMAARLRFGLVLGDGERVFGDPLFFPGGDPMTPPEGHRLARNGGGGGGDGQTYSSNDGLWLWPAPPEGPIELVAQWPGFGLGEAHVTLDAAPLLALMPQVERFWD